MSIATYHTVACVHAWTTDAEGNQTYAEPDSDEVEGWTVYLCHRDRESDALVDPEGAEWFEVDCDDDDEARAIARRLVDEKRATEIREY